MQIRRYRGVNVKEALDAVREELGADALILETRKSASGGFVEISAVIEIDEPAPREFSLGKPSLEKPLFEKPSFENLTLGKSSQKGPGPTQKKVPSAGLQSGEYGSQYVPEEDGTSHVLRELRGLKDFLSVISVRDETQGGKNFLRLEQEMDKSGIDKSFIHDVLIKAITTAAEAGDGTDIDALRSRVKSAVLGEISTKNPISESGQTIMALVGPTGVGKTTTLAKLASIMALKKKKKVALLTMDTFRIAAVEQLKRYADIIGVPISVAETPEDVQRLLHEYKDKDLILIDTAGRGRGDTEQMQKLHALAELDVNVKFNLVLSVNTRDAYLYDTVRRFGGVNIDSLTFTKLDESTEFGPILNTALYSGKPLAFFTDGQRVPEDIEAASSKRLESIFFLN
ncbi:Flagellar biosynthesis protein FlhF [hydrothermal vent metagenome]|uniref:Flagellar biosynthesis protein FlhF n=1 Tax=hydrothermal vent metagenome TaxID=652676 RepID=A0A3B0QUE0_9ZZZZ